MGCAENCGVPQLQFSVRPVPGQGCCARWCNDWGSRNAWFNYGYMSCIIQGGFCEKFSDFYMIGWTRLLRSILRPGRHVVDKGRGMFLTGFAGLMPLALCSYDCWQSADRCFSCFRVALGNLYIISTSLLSFQRDLRLTFLRELIFFGALGHSQL